MSFDNTAIIFAGDRAPQALERVKEMGVYTAEGSYAAAYLIYRLDVIDQRPSASGFGLGADHAALLRQAIDADLPES